MSRRRRILGGLAILLTLAAVGVGIQWLLTPKHRITKESLELIKVGMTQSEVEDILGVPPGDYSHGGLRDCIFFPRGIMCRKRNGSVWKRGYT
jgi:hypothetical protein